MFARLLCWIICLCFSQALSANLDGDWTGEEFAKVTIKAQGISISSFAIVPGQLSVDTIAKTMTFSDDLGTKTGLFSERIKTKWEIVQQHRFNCQFSKPPLQDWFYNELSTQLGNDYLLSNLSIASATASGEELNESDENQGEESHALHGGYKIKVNFKVAEAVNPAQKIAFSIAFDIDFGLVRPNTVPVNLSAITAQEAPPALFQNAAQMIKQILTLISVTKN